MKYPELTEKNYIDEIWKNIEGYEGLYQISNLGRVKSLAKRGNWSEKILKPQKDIYGYLRVGLYKNRKSKIKSIHRLLAENFIPNPYNLPTVDHINRNKLDNRLNNLRWANYTLQNKNKDTTYTPQNLKLYTKKGKENPKSKPVIQYNLNNKIIAEYGSIREAERITKINAMSIINCCKGKKENTNEFMWKYKE